MKTFFLKILIGILLAVVFILFISAIDLGSITIPIAVKDWGDKLSDFVDEKTEDIISSIKESISGESSENTDNASDVILGTNNGELEIHFIDVGQGDATLIKCGDDAMLIDAGYYEYGESVEAYVDYQLEDNHLDYVIGTHPDADHIGGLSEILGSDTLTCDKIFFSGYNRDTGTMYYVEEAMNKKGYSAEVPNVGEVYALGEATFCIIGPMQMYEECNDNSICILLTYGDTKYMFCGDAEELAEEDMIASYFDIDCDVLKISHHGSKTSTTQEFIAETSPTYAVISVGEGNEFFHPHATVLNLLRNYGINVFRTDEQGTVVCTSNGSEIKWNCMPSTSWQAGEGAN